MDNVRVAVNIRPLVTHELIAGCSDCVTVTPNEPQVQIGAHLFTFDHVYGNTGPNSNRIFAECVAPLVDALFHGYNATVLAYGQTGSGKTYTMGTDYNGDECANGIVPKVMQTIFRHVEETKGNTNYLIKVSFIEIDKEDVFDLLESREGDENGKGVGLSRAPIRIRETDNGGIVLPDVTEAEVTSQEEMASLLLRGSVCRATGSTKMNSQSSRSHAIFTISMEQKRIAGVTSGGGHDDVGDDMLSAKLHLVDLAGSKRVKKTGADGMRLREGITINKGLLALGNVISALGDDKKRKIGGHVPYRDSKLTRLLQDSFGGNSKTVMIACVSPADTNAEETLNTLYYANRARNIKNKAIVNRDPVTAQMLMMKNQIEQLQAELLYVKGNSSTPLEEHQVLKQKIALLETSNMDLQKQLQEHQIALLETSNVDLQKQLQEHQSFVEYLTKQVTDTQEHQVLFHSMVSSSLLAAKARVAFMDDHFQLALDYYSQAIALDPKSSCLFSERSQANIKHLNFTEAVADASKAIELDSSNLKAYLHKGTACFSLGEFHTAKTAFEAGSKLAPEDTSFTDWIKKCENIAARRPPSPKLDSVIEEILRGVEPKPRVPTDKELAQESLLQFFNSADKEALLSVKGIGEKRATHILCCREVGPLKSLDDLQDTYISEKEAKYIIKNAARLPVSSLRLART